MLKIFCFSILWVLSAFATFPKNAVAGTINGGGGNAVIYPAPFTKVEMLDIYEARELRQIVPDMGPGKTTTEKLEFILNRFKTVDAYRAKRYGQWIQEFFKEAALGDYQLTPIDDSHHSFVCNGCQVVQLIIQMTPEFPGDKRYLINKSVWDRLDAENQAAAILHEVIYRDAIEQGATDSRATRYFNSLVFSAKFGKKPTNLEYYNLLKKVKLVENTDRGGYFWVEGVLYEANKNPVFYFNKEGALIWGKLAEDTELDLNGQKLKAVARSMLGRYDSGKIKSFSNKEGSVFRSHGVEFVFKYNSNISLFENGELEATFYFSPVTINTSLGPRIIVHTASFYDSGVLSEGCLSFNNETIHFKDGSSKQLDGYWNVYFDTNGNPIKESGACSSK